MWVRPARVGWKNAQCESIETLCRSIPLTVPIFIGHSCRLVYSCGGKSNSQNHLGCRQAFIDSETLEQCNGGNSLWDRTTRQLVQAHI